MQIRRNLYSLLLSITLTASLACTGGEVGDSKGADAATDDDPNPRPERPDAGACAEASVDLSAVTPTVMLLVDRSGSMTENFAGRSRWSAVYDTLMGSGGVVAQLDGEVRFGITTYTSQNGGQSCPILNKVDPALKNYAAIDALLSPLAPVEDTPTGESLQAMIPVMQAIAEPGPEIIVLATDGEPDTCAVPDPDGQPAARAASVAAAQAVHAAGIDTYVISVGNQVSQAHLQDMANAGVGLPVGGQDTAPYYQALDPAQLVAAFRDIVSGVRSCNFMLDRTIDPSYAESGTVTLDGEVLEWGVDWQLREDGQTLELLGEACDKLMTADHSVTAEFTCDAGGPQVL